MQFKPLHVCRESEARTGLLTTDHGVIHTPAFMPVGTQATVKSVQPKDLENIGTQIILGNTFHLYLRPGAELIRKAGGLHAFTGWKKPMLTDSGGFQVYSLSAIRKISEEGVKFQSHIDGSHHFFSPESAMDIQRCLGADIIMAFDECTPFPCEYSYAKKSMELTHRWLDRCLTHVQNNTSLHGYAQGLVPIVQGSTYPDLRKESAYTISEKGSEINAIGGLSVGEPPEEMYIMTQAVCEILPRSKARYLMGVGTPANILEGISAGVDMFDCVMPTRNARHGMLYTKTGEINIKNAKWKEDFSPIDEDLNNGVSTRFSKAYLRHLFNVKEELAFQIASIHNLSFYLWLTKTARDKIEENKFLTWKKDMVDKTSRRR